MEEKRKRLLKLRMPGTGELLSFKTKQYYVSKDGMVWDDAKKRFLKQYEQNSGYKSIVLIDDNRKHHNSVCVHDLVASVFIRLLEQGEHTHHVDKNPQNNNLSNLQIISASEHSRMHSIENWRNGTMDGVAAKASENMKKAWKNGTYAGLAAKLSEYMKKAWKDGRFEGHGEKQKKAWAAGAHEGHGEKVAEKLSKQVAQLDMNDRLVKIWPSTMECKRNGYNNGHVAECCNGKRKSHKGYRWQYLEDYLAHQPTGTSQPVQIELSI